MKKISLLTFISILAFVNFFFVMYLTFPKDTLRVRPDFIYGFLLWAGIFTIVMFTLYFFSLIKDPQILTVRPETKNTSCVILPLLLIILSLPFWIFSLFSTFTVLAKLSFTESGIMALISGIIYLYFESKGIKKLYILFCALALLSLLALLLNFFPFGH